MISLETRGCEVSQEKSKETSGIKVQVNKEDITTGDVRELLQFSMTL